MLSIIAPIWVLAVAEVLTGLSRHGPASFWTLEVAGTLTTASIASVAVFYSHRRIRERIGTLIHNSNQIADGDLSVDTARVTPDGNDALDHLERNIIRIAGALQAEHKQLVARSELSFFDSKLQRGFELCQDQEEALDILARAVREIAPENAGEVLLTDRTRRKLSFARSVSGQDAPGCSVQTTGGCAAVRNGNILTFPSSEALDACPRLRNRESGIRSACCIPINSMGQSIGVLHLTGDEAGRIDESARGRLEVLAFQSGVRLGMLETLHYTTRDATTDPLTDLLNRRSFEQKADAVLGEGGTHAIAMCDIDHFKRLNDEFGHEAGDEALVLFSETLRSVFREEDLLSRHGGEEFVLMLTGCSPEHAQTQLDRFRTAIADQSATSSGPEFTVSIGWASSPSDGTDLTNLLRKADRAVYRAKEEGRNRVIWSQLPARRKEDSGPSLTEMEPADSTKKQASR